ncbi:hypothetical protein ACFUTV_40865 [Streptomyces sp. NPDC057298]
MNVLFDALPEFLGSLMAGIVFAVGGLILKKTRERTRARQEQNSLL